MPTVRFIVTGDLERAALVASLQGMFPPENAEGPVEYLRTRLVGGGATTYPLPPVGHGTTPRNLDRIVRMMLTEVLDGDKDGTPDLVVGLDDLELANLHQPEVVVGWVRHAVQQQLSTRFSSLGARNRAEQRLRERCSLHLLVPMVEAYFFGERGALERAGVAPATPHSLAHTDVEDFETNDLVFLPTAIARNAARQQMYHWWREEKHPKHYLEHLVDLSGRTYDEVQEGATALRTLDWRQVSAGSPPLGFARSLFEDLSDWFGLPANVLGAGVCAPSTYPHRTVKRNTLVLRNL